MRKKIIIDRDFLYQEYIQKRKTLTQIASQFGTSINPIRRLLKEYGIEMRDISDCQIRKKRDYQDKEWLINEYLIKEKSIMKIAKQERVSALIIHKWLKKLGVDLRDKGFYYIGKKNCNFNGYKINNNGYVADKVSGHKRSDRDGYVFRHILVMEKQIKRPLEKGEVVHHRNGDKTDNSKSNLQLFLNMSEHLKFEGQILRFAKRLIWSNDFPKKHRKIIEKYFQEFISKK